MECAAVGQGVEQGVEQGCVGGAQPAHVADEEAEGSTARRLLRGAPGLYRRRQRAE